MIAALCSASYENRLLTVAADVENGELGARDGGCSQRRLKRCSADRCGFSDLIGSDSPASLGGRFIPSEFSGGLGWADGTWNWS